MSEPTFAEHVEHLTAPLRLKYKLNIQGCVLSNDMVRLRFSDEDPRDRWVTGIVSYTDPDVFHTHSKTQTFFLKEYMEYLGVSLEQFFPYRSSSRLAYYQVSGYQVFGFVNFLTLHGDALLRGDAEVMAEYGRAFYQRCVEYTKRVSK